VTGLHAVRVAAFIRRALRLDVDMIHGRYGEFQVLVDGVTVLEGGPLAAVGVLPSRRKIAEGVRMALERQDSEP
jgi:hypothetical protein